MNTRRGLVIVFVVVLSSVSINAQEERLPINLSVPNSLRPVLEKMIQRSPTFRHQIEMLARRPRVRVNVTYGGLRGQRQYHALSTVRRHEWGAMVVQTTLYVPSDVVEIMAHEMEHICEQIEGVDLRRLAAAKSADVISFSDHYETTRAIRVGRQVAREMTGDPEDSRGFLQHYTVALSEPPRDRGARIERAFHVADKCVARVLAGEVEAIADALAQRRAHRGDLTRRGERI